jgi:superfamily II DNA or RNA helicase
LTRLLKKSLSTKQQRCKTVGPQIGDESLKVQVLIYNTHSRVRCESQVLLKGISDVLSYEVPGSSFAKIPGWDGRNRLMKKDGTYPTGLTAMLITYLRDQKIEYKFFDQRTRPAPKYGFEINCGERTPRYYQAECAEISDKKPRGVFLMGTGSGKTLTSALVVDRKKLDTLFVTPDTGLRQQVFNDYVNWFGPHNVSIDVTSDKPIIIANIQSLARKDKKFFARFGMLAIDEFHHSSASTYLDLNKWCVNAFYRYGFTGTFIRSDGVDMPMHGVLSNVIYRKSTSELIEEGFLVRPYITIQEVVIPKSRASYAQAYTAITEYVPFNQVVAQVCRTKVEEGKQTLVLVRRKAHGKMLASMIPGAIFVSGSDKGKEREQIKSDFITKKIRCMVATEIFGEGQDIPSIDVLVNARLQKTEIQTAQGIGRALRKAEGKDKAEVFDFLIVGQRHLNNHSVQRIASYRKESAFVLQILKDPGLKK